MSLTGATRLRLLSWAILLAVVLTVLCIWAAVDVSSLDGVDELFPLRAHDEVHLVLRWVSVAFNTVPMAGAALVAAGLLALKRHHRAAFLVVAAMAVTMVLTGVLKAIVARPRPVEALFAVDNPAMPSGHSAYIAAAASLAGILAYVFVRKRPIRRLVLGAGVVLAVAIGLDRLLLGVHTITDVLAGYCLGTAVVLFATYLFDPAPALIKAEPLASPLLIGDRKLACILNPIKVEDVGQFQALVEEMATGAGYAKPDWYLTTVEDPGRSMAEQAAISGASLVLVCGGDGTVRTVCGELAGTGVPVGVIPAGTGNLLARNLDLPLYLRSAIDVGLNGQDRAVDLVRISGEGIPADEHFLVMAGMGFDAAIMEQANEALKARIGATAYVLSGLRNLMFPAVRVEISVDDGEPTRHRARTIVVGNVGHLQGGLPLLPDAAIDDGLLDVVLLYPQRFLSWLRIVVRVLSRNRHSDEIVTRMQGRKVVIRAAGDTPCQIDGDFVGSVRELTCECLPGKLLLRASR